MPNILFTTPSPSDDYLPFILKGLGVHHYQEPIYRPEGMPMYQWIQCIEGQGVLYFNNEEYTIRPGQGIFLYPHVGHRYHSANIQQDWIVHFVCFTGTGVEDFLKKTIFQHSGVFTLSEPDLITQRLLSIYNSPPMPPSFAAVSHSSILYDMLLQLTLYASINDGISSSIKNERLAPAIAYIEAHYREPLFLDDIAKQCGLSEEYLCQLFKKTIGIRIFEYIQQTRIKHSKELLISMSDLPSYTIGQLCGFNNSSYFNKIFKKYEHMTPGEFRKENGINRR